MFDGIDVTALCPAVRAPTLVMHVRGDGAVPFDEGRLLAALIPGSRFVPLEGTGHILVPGGPAWRPFFDEMRAFLEATSSGAADLATAPLRSPSPARDPALETLSDREREVMRLVAEGRSNAEIADALV